MHMCLKLYAIFLIFSSEETFGIYAFHFGYITDEILNNVVKFHQSDLIIDIRNTSDMCLKGIISSIKVLNFCPFFITLLIVNTCTVTLFIVVIFH